MKKLLILGVLLVSVYACSSSAAPTEEPPAPVPPTEEPAPVIEPTDAPEPTAVPEPTAIPAPELPSTSASAVLGVNPNSTYKVAFGSFDALPFGESDLPVAPGTVEAHWYTSGGVYVVAYIGADLAETGALCPGNSINTSEGFVFVSNAPTEDGACEGFGTLTTDPNVGPRVCQGILLYVTAIPSDQVGTLYGTIEQLADDGAALIGLTSTADTSSDIPEIDLEAFCSG